MVATPTFPLSPRTDPEGRQGLREAGTRYLDELEGLSQTKRAFSDDAREYTALPISRPWPVRQNRVPGHLGDDPAPTAGL